MIYSSALFVQIAPMSKGYVSCHIPMAQIDIKAIYTSISIALLPYFLFPIAIFSFSSRLDQFVSTSSQTVNSACNAI